MTINKTKEADSLNVAVEGRLDTTTSPELEKELKENMDGVMALTIDMISLEYISSAGLRVLLSAQKAMNKQGGTMTIKNAGETIKEIFDVTGFSDILNIE